MWSDVIISVLGGTGAALAVAAWLSKRIVNQQLDKEMGRFKSELDAKADVLKTGLSIYAHEQNVSVSRVDNQRAEAINRIYSAFVEWMDPLAKIVNGTPLKNVSEEQIYHWNLVEAEKAHAAGLQLVDTIYANAIYIDAATYQMLFEAIHESTESVAGFLSPLRRVEAGELALVGISKIIETERLQLKELQDTKMAPLYSKLTQSFRKILGVEK